MPVGETVCFVQRQWQSSEYGCFSSFCKTDAAHPAPISSDNAAGRISFRIPLPARRSPQFWNSGGFRIANIHLAREIENPEHHDDT